MAADLRALGPEYATVEGAERAARLARLLAARPGSRPSLATLDALARSVDAVATRSDTAATLVEIDAAARAYLGELHRLRIDDAHLLDAHSGAARRSRGPRAALAVPTALGLAAHALPYTLLAAAGRLPRNDGMRSSVKLLGSFGLYPVTYAAIGLAVARRRGALAGVAAALAAPLCGWAALITLEADADVTARVRAARLARRGGLAPLAETRRALIERLHAVGLGAPATA